MKNKFLNFVSIIIPTIIIIFVLIYLVYEFIPKYISGKIISIYDSTFSIIDDNNCIFTFNIPSEFDYNLNSNIKIKYNKKINKFTAIQNVNILDTYIINEYNIPTNNMFSKYNSEAYALLENMSVEEKIGQLLLARVPTSNSLNAIKTYHLGGFLLFERDIRNKTKDEVINMIKSFQENSKIPLLIAIDEEGGTVSRLSSNSNIVPTPFLSPQELYNINKYQSIKVDTIYKSSILYDLGINVNLAPIADISTMPTSYMYNRSFAKNAKETSKYIETIFKNSGDKVSYVLKHFPGYGNNIDTHKSIAIDNRSYKEFKKNDFLPFKAGIDNGAQAVLVSHNYVTKLDDKNPASLSTNIHNILKQELDFNGIIITDDLYMNVLNDIEYKYTKAVLAGNNILIVTKYKDAYNEILNSVKNNIISEEYIDSLVIKNLSWKFYKKLL